MRFFRLLMTGVLSMAFILSCANMQDRQQEAQYLSL